jgi:hypothetical protein
MGGVLFLNAAAATAAGKAPAEWDQGEKPKQPPMMSGTFTGTSSTVADTIQMQNVTIGPHFRFVQIPQQPGAAETYSPKLAGLEFRQIFAKLQPKD